MEGHANVAHNTNGMVKAFFASSRTKRQLQATAATDFPPCKDLMFVFCSQMGPPYKALGSTNNQQDKGDREEKEKVIMPVIRPTFSFISVPGSS